MIIYKAGGLYAAGTDTRIPAAQIYARQIARALGIGCTLRSAIWRPTHVMLQA